MPTYQYACTSCGEQLEAVQRFSDEPLTECPACGGRLRKVFSPVGVVFKGSGFYKTDSRTKSKTSGSSEKTESTSTSTDKPAGTTGGTTSGTTGGTTSGSDSSSSSSSSPSSPSSSGQVA